MTTDPNHCCSCDAATIATAVDGLSQDLDNLKAILKSILAETKKQTAILDRINLTP